MAANILDIVDDNPYVGARPIESGESIYGREREVRELAELLTAERIVLLHSPSGAGKTSLIQASLIPWLEQRSFVCMPVARVGLNVDAPAAPHNRYLLSVLLSLAGRDGLDALAVSERIAASELTLAGFIEEKLVEISERERRIVEAEKATPLENLSERELLDRMARMNRMADGAGKSGNQNIVLVFDQFEEILTLDPTDKEAKSEFFRQVGSLLRDRRIWALFSIREDYVAALEPYLDYIPTRLNIRYRIDFLGRKAAADAIREPARSRGVFVQEPDGRDAVDLLVDDLSTVYIQQPSGRLEKQQGDYVEPVHLQIVCWRLWNRLRSERWQALGPGEPKTIVSADIERGEDVNRALASYYQDKIKEIAGDDITKERLIRRWFEDRLISKQGFRSQVLKGEGETEGLDNEIISSLLKTFLIKEERRLGASWYELAHDRLVEPVRLNNIEWREKNLGYFQLKALSWLSHQRTPTLLLTARELVAEQAWLDDNKGRLLPEEEEFLRESCELRKKAVEKWRLKSKQKQFRETITYIVTGAVIVIFGLVILLELQHWANVRTMDARRISDARKFAAFAADSISLNPERSMLLALHGIIVASKAASLKGDVPYDLLEPLNLAAQKSQVRYTLSERAGPDGDSAGSEYSHADKVLGLAYSQDGNFLATAGADRTVKLWSSISGRLALTLKGFGAPVYSVAFSPRCPGSLLLATAGADGGVKLWHIKIDDKQLQLETEGDGESLHEADAEWRFFSAAFSADGSKLVAGGNKGVVLWELSAGGVWTKSYSLPARAKETIYGVAFNSAGDRVAIASSIGAQLTDAQLRRAEPLPVAGPIHGVIFSRPPAPGQTGTQTPELLALAGGDGVATIWNARAETAEKIATLAGHSGQLYAIAFDEEGRRLATAGEDKQVKVWDVRSGKELYMLVGHAGSIRAVTFSPNGSTLATASEDNSAKIWAASYGNVAPVRSVAFSDDGHVLLSLDAEGTIILRDVNTGEEKFSSSLAAAAAPPPLAKQSAASSAPPSTLAPAPTQYKALAFSDESRPAIFVATGEGVKSWRISGKSPIPSGQLFAHRDLTSMAVSPDKKRLATVGGDGIIKLWSASTVKCRSNIEVNTRGEKGEPVVTPCLDESGSAAAETPDAGAQASPTPTPVALTAVAFNEDGTRLATGSEDGAVRVWNLGSDPDDPHPQLLPGSPFYGHTARINAIAFDSRNKRLATGGDDKTIKVWNIDEKKDLKLFNTIYGHVARINSLSFNAEGSLLASASDDGTTKIWDTQPTKEQGDVSWVNLLTLETHMGSVTAVAFSPEPAPNDKAAAASAGSLLVTAGADRQIYFHILPERASAAEPVDENADRLIMPAAKVKELISGRVLQQLTRAWSVDECREFLGGSCSPEYSAIEKIIEGNSLARDPGRNIEEAAERYQSAAAEKIGYLTIDNPGEEAKKNRAAAIARRLNNYSTAGLWDKFRNLAETQSEWAERAKWRDLLDAGSVLARNGRIVPDAALELFDSASDKFYKETNQTDEQYKTLANNYNLLCFYGALTDHAADVRRYCDHAVELAKKYDPNNTGNYQDSYGIALLRLGNNEEAIEKFNEFIKSSGDRGLIEQRKRWIKDIPTRGFEAVGRDLIEQYPPPRPQTTDCPP